VLQNLNLKIPAGKITAIVGESGAGKSTLLKLLAGLILPTSGEIFFSELPTSKFQRESLFSKVAYMPQSPKLFDATLSENFSMFNQLETAELEKLLTALNLKLDLNSAKKISRGQLQRLGLIRALLKNSSLIILDEPTAGLDFETEKKVLAVLKNYSSRKTIIIATHRQSVINFSENVIQI
jgi:ABC-type transport system involved in cytochrome bd biosynthesis fused ATPase/permease subunit